MASSLDLSINKQDIMTTYGSAVLAQGGLFAWAFESVFSWKIQKNNTTQKENYLNAFFFHDDG